MSDDKYIVFRRDDFIEMLKFQGMEHLTTNMLGDSEKIEIRDAVVIRRQDYFASAALNGYAASIAIAAKLTDDPKKRLELIDVADYFQRQSELAAEEGWKTPDV